jgi:hypothetical protein
MGRIDAAISQMDKMDKEAAKIYGAIADVDSAIGRLAC